MKTIRSMRLLDLDLVNLLRVLPLVPVAHCVTETVSVVRAETRDLGVKSYSSIALERRGEG